MSSPTYDPSLPPEEAVAAADTQGPPRAVPDGALVGAVVALWLGGEALEAANRRIAALLTGSGLVTVEAAAAALRLASAGLPPLVALGRLGGGPVAGAARDNLRATAAYLVGAAKRLTAAAAAGDLAGGIARERRFLALHDFARRNRLRAAKVVALAAKRWGPILGWYSVCDSHTSPECSHAHKKNFYAARRPMIGWPGGVHPHCRCTTGPPHRRASFLP